MDVTLKDGMNIYVNNKLADMDTLVYSNFSIIWTLEELSLSDVEKDEAYNKSQESYEEDEYTYDEDDACEDVSDDSEDVSDDSDAVDGLMADTLDALKKVRAELEGVGPGDEDDGSGEEEAASVKEDTLDAFEEKSPEAADGDGGIKQSIIVNINGDDVRLTGKTDYIYVDIFEFIDFDLSKPQGRAVVTKLNDRNAVFNEPIKAGDRIEVYWSN